jgi:soluble lytic murein transglycosylase
LPWKKGSFAIAKRVASLFALTTACGQQSHAPPIALVSGDAAEEIPDAADEAAFDAGEGASSWVDAIRRGAWHDAAVAIDALPDAEKNRPPVRYARARVAIAEKDFARVVKLLDGLEAPLPLLADAIAKRRARAELEVGPYDKAADYFSSKTGAEAQLEASRAYERAGNVKQAEIACDHAIAADDRTRAREAEARARRLRLGGRSDADEATDARWLAIHAPDLPDGRDALSTLAHLDGAHPLNQSEMLDRAKSFSEAGRTDDALLDVEASIRAPLPAIPILVRLHVRAEILSRDRKRQLDASRAYDACVNAAGPGDSDDAVHAARSLSRADHDDEAITRYAGILARFPRTPAAEQSAFLGARLELLHGRYAKAAAAFDAYDKTFPNGASRKEAERDRAIAHLMNGDPKGAQTMFERIADSDRNSGASDLAALAALREGDKAYAVTRWTTIVTESPSSWRGIVARARLAEQNASSPPAASSPAQNIPPLSPRLPPPADLLASLGLDDEAESALFSRENTIGAASPARALELECDTYGLLDVARRREQVSLRVSRSLLVLPIDARNEWAWKCAYPSPYEATVKSEETNFHLPPGLIWSVMRQESEFSPSALSPVHAVGLMQLMPETARVTEGDPKIDEAALTEPSTSIRIGAKYLRELLDRFHGSVPLAVAAYNAGPEAIERWISRAQAETLDIFVEQIPYAETRNYVISVMTNLGAYGAIRGGEAEIPVISLSLNGAAPQH